MRNSNPATPILAAAVLAVLVAAGGLAHDGAPSGAARTQRRAVIFVMPNALEGPAKDGSAVVAESSHNGQEPQVAKIYHELQESKSCQAFSENMIKDKADYFLLLQHGGGKGNRWAVSDRDGNVIASGESFKLGTSVGDACLAISKDWQQHSQTASGGSSDQDASR